MIVVDSSVWIDYLRNTPTPQVELLDAAFAQETVAIPDLTLAEVLQGCRTDSEFERTRARIKIFPVVNVMSEALAIRSAQHYRHLRGKGITVRKTIDCLIATRCILDGLPLLYSDRDFEPFVTHLGLIPAIAASGVN